MSYRLDGTNIFLTRGDSMDLKIKIKMPGTKQIYIPSSDDKIFFGVKKRTDENICSIYKEIPTDTMLLHLDPEDTKYLEFGNYWYDIQLKKTDGFVSTFITKSLFKIMEDICYNE